MRFSWDDDKNKWLQKDRGVSFEQVLDCFIKNEFYGVFKNPSANFPNQEVFLVAIDGYPFVVPFVDDGKKIFLKTIIPDRRFKKYLIKE